MAITEEARYQLHKRPEEVFGLEDASTLMAHLPPVGWADVATKRDLDLLGEQIELRLEALRLELRADTAELRTDLQGSFDRGLREQGRTFFLGVLASNATIASLAIAAARLF